MSALGNAWLVHLMLAFVQATLAGLLLLTVERVARRASPKLRHALLLIALAKFALPPMLPLPTGIFSAAPPASRLRVVRPLTSGLPTEVVMLLMLLHAAGAAVMLLRLAAGTGRLRALRRRATRLTEGDAFQLLGEVARAHGVARPLLVASDEIDVAISFGVVRPVIALPRALTRLLDRAALRDVLAHELLHIRRGDLRLNLLQSLLAAVWWFHPLVHVLARRARALREECCDDELLASGLHDAAGYARTLLASAALMHRRPFAAAAAVTEEPHALVGRVRRIAAAHAHPARRLGWSAFALITLATLILLPGLRVSEQNRVAFDAGTLHALGIHHHQH